MVSNSIEILGEKLFSVIAQNKANGKNQDRQHQSKAAILGSGISLLRSVSTSGSWWLFCHFFGRCSIFSDATRTIEKWESYGSPVIAPDEPHLTRTAPSMKMFQATSRNTFFRMRRDDSTRKNSCQAKSSPLQSNQYPLAGRVGEALSNNLMLSRKRLGTSENHDTSYTAG